MIEADHLLTLLWNLQKSNNPVLVGKRIIALLSSERTRADLGDISTDTINNWSKP
jgi:hypothetical protein